MLKIDLSRLSKAEIERLVASNCAEFGDVNSIAVLCPESATSRAFAFVTMASAHEREAVAKKLGDGLIGEMVVVRLVQEEQFIQNSRSPTATSTN
jgi:phosphopantetheinyl transferase